jgi:hypothetical protein
LVVGLNADTIKAEVIRVGLLADREKKVGAFENFCRQLKTDPRADRLYALHVGIQIDAAPVLFQNPPQHLANIWVLALSQPICLLLDGHL